MEKREMRVLFLIIYFFFSFTILWQMKVANCENLVVNGGFEQEKNGVPISWSIPKDICFLDTAISHSGKFSLKYTRTDKNDYRLISQQIPCLPGKLYKASVWIKGENIKNGDPWEQGASFCIEWLDENGKYLGGEYPSSIDGTFDWKKISTIVRIPKEAKIVQITLYLRSKNTGTAWFDDVEVHQITSPLLYLYMLSPAYRGNLLMPTKGKNIKAKIVINREDYDLIGIPLRIVCELKDVKGYLFSKLAEIVKGDENEKLISIPLPDLEPGEYRLLSHIYLNDKEVGKVEEKIKVVREVNMKVYIDEKQRLIVDSKPFFPIGLYLYGETEEEDFERISKAGFNTILSYWYGVEKNPEDYMEKARKYGLKVIYSVKDFYEESTWFPKHLGKSGLELAREYGEKFRDHPALLAWYINDELPIVWIPRLQEMYNLLRNIDPNHPQFQVLCQIDGLVLYYNCTDIMGVDQYPIPVLPIDIVSKFTSSAVKAVENAKPVWFVPQLHDLSIYYTQFLGKRIEPREPTFLEMKNMFYQALIHGAKGLIAYSYTDLFKTKGGEKVPKEVFERRWKEVCEIVSEIKKIVPAILEGEDVMPLNKVLSEGKLHLRGLLYNNNLYILCANTSNDKLSINISLPSEGWKSAIRIDGSKFIFKDNQLYIELLPLEATTYVLSK